MNALDQIQEDVSDRSSPLRCICQSVCVCQGVDRAPTAVCVQSRGGVRAGDAPWMESSERQSEEACLPPPETTQATGAESLYWMQDCLAVHYA
ncbi:hypothetical protein CesoFtcFv8_007810 [Champsocephalus esox]|uniref:Uncharacterized protein n=1 Tax=Champsocephalus esox TaxID=159716 RepID=A0AAN8CI62_9TELE|nr:hypothetical protein CesoFtcFv8_007810 [Champsocephalus esox]